MLMIKARADGWKKPTPAQAAAGNYFKPRMKWNGLDIVIENPAGTVREGTDELGARWRTEFAYAYGEVAGTEGVDGDPVDVYMGPDESAPEVYIVRQMRRLKWDQYDEDKCFLGFPSMAAAKKAYLEHYDDPRFFGGIIAMPVAEFIEKVRATREKPAMIKTLVLFGKSQGSLFDSLIHVPASVRKDGTTVKPYERIQKIRRPAQPKPKAAAPVELFAPEDMPGHAERKAFADQVDALRTRVQRFASGMSRERDFSAAVHSGHGVGVEVNQLSDNAMRALAAQAVNNNAALFVDSGAFSVFKRGIKQGDEAPADGLDFDDVLARYDKLLDYIAEANESEEHVIPPLIVMPDVVGDQTASLNLIAQHRDWIHIECNFNISRPIIPLQRGALSIGEAYDHVVGMLGTDKFVCGIPSNAAAISPEEFTEFLRSRQPKAVHILGALHDKRLTPRLEQIVNAGVANDIEVSADANVLRSQIIEQGVSGAARSARIVDRLSVEPRARELANVIDSYGGVDGIRQMIAAESPDRQARLFRLIADLSGRALDDVKAEYAA